MKYLILISTDNVRDVQVYAGVPDDPDKTFSDDWADYKTPKSLLAFTPRRQRRMHWKQRPVN